MLPRPDPSESDAPIHAALADGPPESNTEGQAVSFRARSWLGGGGRLIDLGGIFVAESAVIVGDVELGPGTNVWPFVAIRGDVAPIRVGRRVSIQDHVMLHCRHGVALEIGDDVVIGHHACVHCARVGSGTLVGIGSRILDDAVIGAGCVVAAGAVVTPGTKVPEGMVVAGVPARVLRPVEQRDRDYVARVAARYVRLAASHVAGGFPPWNGTNPMPQGWESGWLPESPAASDVTTPSCDLGKGDA